MLLSLHIKNYALISETHLQWDPQLTVITGETGAGKSIILGALSLITGQRVDHSMIIDKDEKCVVEGHIDLSRLSLREKFKEWDLPYDDLLILRREVYQGGRSRGFINDTPASIDQMEELAASILTIHRQDDTGKLCDENYHRALLDSLAGTEEELEKYRVLYMQYRSDIKELEYLQEKEAQSRTEQDFIAFQLNEINELQLKEAEQMRLEEIRERGSHASGIVELLEKTQILLRASDDDIVSRLFSLVSEYRDYKEIDPKLTDTGDRINSTAIELDDIAGEVASLIDKYDDFNPAELEQAENRLNDIYKLIHKHNLQDSDELLVLADKMTAQLRELEEFGGKIDRLSVKIKELEKELSKRATKLFLKRKAAGEKIVPGIKEKLKELGMPYASVKYKVTKREELRSYGKNRIELLFSANKGIEVKPVNKIASGGELSRLALVLSSLLAGSAQVPVLVFDEIDTGVSGKISTAMGKILKELSKNRQVICITHSPQIAAFGNKHFYVYKTSDKTRSETEITEVSPEDNRKYLGIMLSEDPPSETALEHAGQLIKEAAKKSR